MENSKIYYISMVPRGSPGPIVLDYIAQELTKTGLVVDSSVHDERTILVSVNTEESLCQLLTCWINDFEDKTQKLDREFLKTNFGNRIDYIFPFFLGLSSKDFKEAGDCEVYSGLYSSNYGIYTPYTFSIDYPAACALTATDEVYVSLSEDARKKLGFIRSMTPPKNQWLAGARLHQGLMHDIPRKNYYWDGDYFEGPTPETASALTTDDADLVLEGSDVEPSSASSAKPTIVPYAEGEEFDF